MSIFVTFTLSVREIFNDDHHHIQHDVNDV